MFDIHPKTLTPKIPSTFRKYEYQIILATITLLLFLIVGLWLIGPPKSFPRGEIITISRGASVQEIASHLHMEGVVRFPKLFVLVSLLERNANSLQSGDYVFDTRHSSVRLLTMIEKGLYGSSRVRVVLREGSTVYEMGKQLQAALPNFDADLFKKIAKDKEGYLFPDTYLLFPTTSPARVVEIMEEQFTERIETIADEIDASERSFEDIMIMASIIEKEAAGARDRKTISGILWRRFDIGMALQVDVSFAYLLGKASNEVTLADLENDSPYNTYKHIGLPPGPIGNPGLASIKAALDPEPSPYLFYLHDRRGNAYYAETYEGHLVNRRQYIE